MSLLCPTRWSSFVLLKLFIFIMTEAATNRDIVLLKQCYYSEHTGTAAFIFAWRGLICLPRPPQPNNIWVKYHIIVIKYKY